MKSIFKFFILIGCLFVGSIPLWAVTISGNTSLCEGECLSYTASGGVAPYTWVVTGGLPTSFVGTNFNICWGNSGTGSIVVTDAISSSATQTITINPKPAPNIVPPLIPACPSVQPTGGAGSDNHGNNCLKACANTCLLYYVPYTVGSTYTWQAGGAASVNASGTGNSQATVCWGNVGNGWLKVVETNVFGCKDSTKICINKIPSPTASFTPSPTLTVCQGQSVSFTNTSNGAVTYQWTFGGGTPATSSQTHPTVVFNAVGTYTVTLIAQNACLCSDTATTTITVLPGQGPPIECISALCAGTSSSYSTTAGCGPYTWSIVGGTITGGAGTANIQVNWGFIPPFTLSLTAGGCGYCPMPTTVNVPIIPLTMPIQGNTTACYGDIATYSLLGNTCGGSYHTWTVDPTLGFIMSGQGSQTITVQWFSQFICSPQMTTVSVVYDNCYLDCEHGSGSINVRLAQQFIAEGPPEACLNNNTTFKAACSVGFPGFSPTLCNWTVITPTNVVIPNVATNTATLNYTWASGVGTYTVIATAVNPNAWCNTNYTTTIDVFPLPPAPTGISGPLTICPNSTYTYQAFATPFVGIFNWTVTNGTVVPINGNTVNVTWGNTGPYTLSVYQQDMNSPNCTSPPYTINVSAYIAAIPTGLASVCLGQTTTYSVTAIPSSNYTWSISPPGAGAFLSSTNSNTVTVQWNITGAASISATVCGQTSTKNVTVNGTTNISLSPVSYCAGGSATLTAPVSVCAPYIWKNASNVTVSTGSTATITTPGYYSLTATNCITGCPAIGTVFVTQNPVPVAAITTPDPTVYCTLPINSILYAQTNPGYTFQWYQGVTPVGTNTSTYTATAVGSYTVIVTNSFGCSATSNVITISYVTPCPPQPCTPVGTVMGSTSPTTQCNVWNFNGSTTGGATITGWNYGDGFSGANPSTHTYAQAGYYTATINAIDVNGCPLSATRLVIIPVAPNFNYVASCNRLVTFNGGLSTFVSPYSITSSSWNFGDPASGGANTATGIAPTHTFIGPGNTFNVTLTVTSNTGCTATIILPVNIYPQATAVITPPTSACAGTGISFNGSSSLGTLVGYSWNFGDPPSGAANTSTLIAPSHAYTVGGTYTVTLTVTDIYGCTNSTSTPVTVYNNPLSGSIAVTPSASVCLGTPVTLTAPSGGTSYLWSNGQTNQIITTNTSGTYSVTITNANGCQYIPSPKTITVYPLPAGIIEGPTEICEGDEAILQMSPCNPNYTYNWSNGNVGCSNTISPIWLPLVAGTHTFSVTITDNNAPNCTVILSHTITVYPLPASFTITSSPGGNVCEGTTVTLTAPVNPSVTYFWSTGQSGNNITIVNAPAGDYYAVAIDNITGCERKSNTITVYPLPDVCMAPQGCYTVICCDTLCVPPVFSAYQWYFNGNPIIGAINNTFVTCHDTLGSGMYQVLLTNTWGCSALSPPLNLTILPCDTGCAYIVSDTIRCHQTPTGVSYQYGFNLFNNSGFAVNAIQLVNITSTGVLPTITPNPFILGSPIPNNANGLVNWFNISGAGVMPGDTICFQMNVAKLTGGIMDSCCTSPITHCVVIPACCNCNQEEFLAAVGQGFTITPTGTCGQYVFTPNALGPCDSVEWLISPPIYSVGNTPITVTLPAGTHYVCMLVKRYDANGNLCAVYEKCVTIIVPPCCICDQNFYNQVQLGFSMLTSGYTGTFTPLGTFNNNCDIVQWSYTSNIQSVIMGSSIGSNPFNYTFPGPGYYTVYMCVTRTQPDGTTCQYCVCRKLWIPHIIISDDDTDILDLFVTQININPHGHGCNTGWIDADIHLLNSTTNGTITYNEVTEQFTYNPNTGFVGNDVFMYSLCVSEPGVIMLCDTISVVLNVGSTQPVGVHLRAIAAGAYNTATASMRTTLVQENLIPIVQPFDCMPWYYTGTETFGSTDLIPDNMVDYLFIEARDPNNPSIIIARTPAYLLSDGTISNRLLNNNDPTLPDAVYFDNLSPNGSYYFVVRHRNHLSIMTASVHNVSNTSLINLTNPANVMGGVQQLTHLSGNTYGMRSGDMNANGVITVADYNVFVPESSSINVYNRADCNLDGNVIVTDFNLFSSNSSAIGVYWIRY